MCNTGLTLVQVKENLILTLSKFRKKNLHLLTGEENSPFICFGETELAER